MTQISHYTVLYRISIILKTICQQQYYLIPATKLATNFGTIFIAFISVTLFYIPYYLPYKRVYLPDLGHSGTACSCLAGDLIRTRYIHMVEQARPVAYNYMAPSSMLMFPGADRAYVNTGWWPDRSCTDTLTHVRTNVTKENIRKKWTLVQCHAPITRLTKPMIRVYGIVMRVMGAWHYINVHFLRIFSFVTFVRT